jgi:hypothetical protein
MYVAKNYRNTCIAAVHMKVTDILSVSSPSIISPMVFYKVVKRVDAIINECLYKCGLVKVGSFSGVIVAATCDEESWNFAKSAMAQKKTGRFGSGGPNTKSMSDEDRVVAFFRMSQAELEAYSHKWNFNIPLGVALNHGSAEIGFSGKSHISYDISGRARDMAIAMASFHSEGFFASGYFAEILQKSRLSDDLIHQQPHVDLRRQQYRWLRCDGSFHGIRLNDFNLVGLLGEGGYGSVYLVKEKQTNEPYAVKIVKLKPGALSRECIILLMMSKHPNIVDLKYSFIDNNRLCLVMSYVNGGNLKQVIERDELGLKDLVFLFAELVLAIEYVHSKGIIHRDVKPTNCMIGTDGHLKLADFGLSKIMNNSEFINNDFRNGNSSGFGNLAGGSAVPPSPYSIEHSETAKSLETVKMFLPLKANMAKRVGSYRKVLMLVPVGRCG